MKTKAVFAAPRHSLELVTAAFVALAMLVLAVPFGPSAGATEIPGLTEPAPPPPGALGGQGPCTVGAPSSFTSTVDSRMSVFVFEPSGTAATPLLGGRCDSATRPVIFFHHGFAAYKTTFYENTIDHLVSVGNIVVFSAYYSTLDPEPGYVFDPVFSYNTVTEGNREAAARFPRIDTTRTGWIGHSFGGGMTPYQVQQGASWGWGTNANWMLMLAPAASLLTGMGAIPVPANTRALVVGFDHDESVDLRIGIQIYRDLQLPLSQKQHITARSDFFAPFVTGGLWASPQSFDGTLEGTHGSPIDGEYLHELKDDNDFEYPEVDNALKYYGVWRNADALQSCALNPVGWFSACNLPLVYMGSWSNGWPVRPAVSTDNPVDVGPPAEIEGFTNECENFLGNPRFWSCPPSVQTPFLS